MGMPQLDFLTYMSQLVGLALSLTALYLITLKWILPQIKEIKEVRNLLLNEMEVQKEVVLDTPILHKTLPLPMKFATPKDPVKKEYLSSLSELLIKRNVT